MNIQGSLGYRNQQFSAARPVSAQVGASQSPLFGGRKNEIKPDEYQAGTGAENSSAGLSGSPVRGIGKLSGLVAKGQELILMAEPFARLVKSDKANTLISKRYPDTYTGEYDESLHKHLRGLANGAATGKKEPVALFAKALTLARVQTLMASELSAKPVGKKKLVDIIEQKGQHNPNMVKHLRGLIQQSIRHGEGWDHFMAVRNNEALRTAIEDEDVQLVLEQLKHRRLCRSDKQQASLPARLLANPYNFGIFSRILGSTRQAENFIQRLIAADIEHDLRKGKARDHVGELAMREQERRERVIGSLPIEIRQEWARQYQVSIEDLGEALRPKVDAEEQRRKDAEAREIWRWKDTPDQEIQDTVRLLTEETMAQYRPMIRYQVNP